MKRDIVAKRVIQAVACGFGLLGLFAVYMSVSFALIALRDLDRHESLITGPLFLVLGGIMIAVAWQTLRRFEPDAIRNVVGLVMFFAWSQLAWFPESSQHSEPCWRSDLAETALVLGSLCLAFLLYRILSRKLIQVTETGASDNGPSFDTNPTEHDPIRGKCPWNLSQPPR
jgi:hypothetical protein